MAPFLVAMAVSVWADAGTCADSGAAGVTIPTVDVSAFLDPAASEEARGEAVRAWDSAMAFWGFARVVGHGVPQGDVDALRAAALAFFDEPLENKLRYSQGPTYGPEGYTARGIESVGRTLAGGKAPADIVENLVVRTRLPEEVRTSSEAPEALADRPYVPPALVPAVRAYWAGVERLLAVLHGLAEAALGAPKGSWSKAYEARNSNALRFAHYPAVDSGAAPEAGQLRYGAHTDYSGFTLLLPDPWVGGLEVLNASAPGPLTGAGDWVPVPTDGGGAFVVNAGDLIAVWSNHRWRSAYHRVNNQDLKRRRMSVAFFTGPDDAHVVEPVVREGEPRRAEAVSAGEHLRRKLQLSNV